MIAYIIFIINSASTLPGRLPEYVGTTYFEMSPKYLEWYIKIDDFWGTPIGKIHFCCTYESEDRSEVVTTDSSNLPWRSMKLTCRHRPTMTYENLPWLAISLKIICQTHFPWGPKKKTRHVLPQSHPNCRLLGVRKWVRTLPPRSGQIATDKPEWETLT